jgi:prepilin-type N-terminal cleavage/methylation domain-containing protein/prepilin-type processing-associated H-X9-DG protein
MKERKGFTLIELLVVIAIIALLLSIISPALRRAKEAAWNIMCRNGLKHYGMAGQMYLEENRQTFPNAWSSIFISVNPDRGCQFHDQSRNPLRRPDLAGSLWPYLGVQDKGHVCPVFDRFARQFHTHGTVNIPIEPVFSYSMNALLGGVEPGDSFQFLVKIGSIRSPTTVFFFGEENPWNSTDVTDPAKIRNTAPYNDDALCGTAEHPKYTGAWDRDPSTMISKTNSGGTKYLDLLGSFHKTTFEKKEDGESNAVFVDGHVEMVNWEDTYRLSRWTRTRPTPRP